MGIIAGGHAGSSRGYHTAGTADKQILVDPG